ncbi:MAG: asparagine synthase (glutamine-hydrolyzing), partial [Nitrospira sp.]|nr:asparagine synthase (glutamine-hydrolyzing) [Nitrospira sp.]
MCGIVGILQPSSLSGEAGVTLRSMAGTLRHRGPDDEGIWMDERAGVGLGHRRLSILDLSPAGHQPMMSADGRYVIVFNGEIYNFEQLRSELESAPLPQSSLARGEGSSIRWRGHSDTEVMLEAVSRWGLEAAVQRFNGMFAFALWDRETQTLSLGRDRLGEKPLYYGWAGQTFLFASELKALRAYPGFKEDVDRDALTLFLRYGYIPAPHCIFRGLRKLPPGMLLTVRADDAGHEPTPAPYWSLKDVVERGTAVPFKGSDDDAVAQLDELLRDAVKLRMVADVPLGAFLSGGIDSSTVVALMQAQSGRPVKTFSIGFHEDGYNEATFAGAVARHLGTDHTELYVTPVEARDVIPRLPALYDEPFADSSQIPTFLVSELARRQVTVSLSGDGGDEVFGGYNRYFLGQRLWNGIRWMPKPVRRGLGNTLRAFSPRTWNALFHRAAPLLPGSVKVQHPGDKLQKLADLLTVDDPRMLYWGLVSLWKNPADVVIGATEPVTVFNEVHHRTNLTDF